jgi:glycosyltransferase involved in cell wall biosynthesis
MKVAVAAPTYIPARRANTVQVMKMTQAIAETGHEVSLCIPGAMPAGDAQHAPWLRRRSRLRQKGLGEKSRQDAQWQELAQHYGLQKRFPVTWLGGRRALRGYDYGLRAVLWAKGWGAEVLYTRLPQAAAIASLLGIPTVFEVHDLPLTRTAKLVYRMFLRGQGRRRLVLITRSLASDLETALGAAITASSIGEPFLIVAPDGVDLARFRDLPEPFDARCMLAREPGTADPWLAPMKPDHFTAGYTGHLYPGRGSDLILAMAARLPDINFLLAGGEPADVEELRRKATSQNLHNVYLTGFIPNAELPRYQAACDVLLMPYQEKVAASSGGDIGRYLSPMKLFEYMASCRAILSSNLQVLQEVLNESNAVLLPPGDVTAWEVALNHLRANPVVRQRLALQAVQDVQQYTWEARAKTIFDFQPAGSRSAS